MIVDHLRAYRQPVFVYLPPGCELRGGAWVVVDSQINADMVEMYADSTAQVGAGWQMLWRHVGLACYRWEKGDERCGRGRWPVQCAGGGGGR
jgi:hypothetical protein